MDRRLRSVGGALRVGAALLLAVSFAACGDEGSMMEPELVTTPPPPVLSGRVLAADSFAVPATTTNFTVDPYSSGGTLPADVGPTAGKLLVLSVRDISRPDIECTGGIGGSNCGIIVALPSRDEGFVSVQSESARRSFFLHSSYRLEPDPEPT
jgi:hypothetical protein